MHDPCTAYLLLLATDSMTPALLRVWLPWILVLIQGRVRGRGRQAHGDAVLQAPPGSEHGGGCGSPKSHPGLLNRLRRRRRLLRLWTRACRPNLKVVAELGQSGGRGGAEAWARGIRGCIRGFWGFDVHVIILVVCEVDGGGPGGLRGWWGRGLLGGIPLEVWE